MSDKPLTKHHENAGAAADLRRFRSTSSLSNHWARLGNLSAPRTYYWYLTFQDAPQVRTMAARCQEDLQFSYYDLVAADELHLTIDRIGDEGQISTKQLRVIEEKAVAACTAATPFLVTIGSLTGTAGAVGFDVSPVEPLVELREALRSATLAGGDAARPKAGKFHAHIAIAYANAEVDPTEAIETVVRLHSLPPVQAAVTNASLVLLERRRGSYTWNSIASIPLRGDSSSASAAMRRSNS